MVRCSIDDNKARLSDTDNAHHNMLLLFLGRERTFHALTFIFTLQLVVLSSVIFGNLTKLAVNRKIEDALPLVGAILCWIIALYLYIKSVLKRRKKEAQKMLLSCSTEETEELTAQQISYSSVGLVGSLVDDSNSENIASGPEQVGESSKLGLVTVFTLTLLGALDELTYFPSLIIGGTFRPVELAVGALIACVLILVVISCVLTAFQPILEMMDRIPLYAVVALFAAVLTVDAMKAD